MFTQQGLEAEDCIYECALSKDSKQHRGLQVAERKTKRKHLLYKELFFLFIKNLREI
jgi:hypothetical protein